MKLHRSHPLALVISFTAAAAVFGADTKPKKPAAPATKPAAATGAKVPEGVAAVVNGDPIKDSDVEEAFTRLLAGRPASSIPPEQKKAAMGSSLNNLIVERLLNKAAAGIKIDKTAVDGEYEKIRKANPATDEQVTKELAAMGMTIESLKARIENHMRQRQWVDEQIKGKAAEATEAEAKDFYQTNPQHFESAEQVRASHILFRLAPDATPEQVTAAMKKGEAAVKRAAKEDFAKLAAELSEEPGAAERGGDLSYFPRQGAMVEPFAAAAFKLKKDEISSEPVRTQFGYHVIKVTDRKAGGKQPFEEVKPRILAFLTDQRKGVAINAVLAALREKADVQLSAAASDLLAPPKPLAPEEAPKK